MKEITFSREVRLGYAEQFTMTSCASMRPMPHSPCPLYCDTCELHQMELRALKLQVQRMRTNAPAPKVVEILAVLIGNFACFDMDMKPEGWTLDAYDFRDGGRFDRILSPWAPESHNQNFPLVTAHTRVSVMCRLSSIIPDGMDRGQPFTFQLSLVDPKA